MRNAATSWPARTALLVLRRVARTLLVLFLVTLGTFFLVSLIPGSPEFVILGDGASAEDLQRVRNELGLDDPVHERYLDWLGGVVQLDFGNTLLPPVEPVGDRISRALPVSLELAVLSIAIALAISLPAAMLAAHRPGGRLDRMISSSSVALVSIPNFLSAIILILLFSLTWNWLPNQLWVRPSDGGWALNLKHAFLPALAVALTEIGVFTRLLRSDLIGTLREDFVLAARSRGLSSSHVMLREALRPSSFSLVTLIGVSFARLVGGTIIVEQIFALPGLGRLIIQSAQLNDIQVVQAGVLVIAFVYVMVNAGVDIVYGILDPRVRRGRL